MRRSRGFTIIEVLVALALIAVSFATIMQLFSKSMSDFSRVGRASQAVLLERQLVQRFRHFNPAEQKSGAGELGGVAYTWSVSLQEPMLAVRMPEDDVQQKATFGVGLYRIRVLLTGRETPLELTRVGWLALQ